MKERGFDGIIIGAGPNGLTLGAYLAKAGLKVLLLERRYEIGGGLATEHLTLPGLLIDSHAIYHMMVEYAPPLKDLEFDTKYDLEWIYPELQVVMPFSDGKYLALYKDIERSYQSIKKFSAKDAEAFKDFARWSEEAMDLFLAPASYVNPMPALDQAARLEENEITRRDDELTGYTPKQIVDDLFDSPEMRTFFMRAFQTSNGLMPEDVPGAYWTLHVLGLTLSLEAAAIPLGGTHSITHALVRAFQDMGGEFFVLSEAERILVDDGVARGVRLKNGVEVGAKIVVSDLSIDLTFDLLGKENLPRDLWDKVQKLRENAYERTQLFWGNIALYEPPEYPQSPELGFVPRLYLGESDPEYFASGRYKKERWETGIAKKLYLLVAPDSMWDATRAPEGRFTALVEEFTCPWKNFSERDWLRMKREIVSRMLNEWRRYAPNVTQDNFIEAWIATPDDVVNRNPCMPGGGWGALDAPSERLGRLRPLPELSNYRMPVKNVYLCSSAAHSAHGIGRGSSYCCYKVIASDLGLSYKPWEEAGRPY